MQTKLNSKRTSNYRCYCIKFKFTHENRILS